MDLTTLTLEKIVDAIEKLEPHLQMIDDVHVGLKNLYDSTERIADAIEALADSKKE